MQPNPNSEDESFNEVLVVDDNANNLKLVRSLLTEKGYKIRLATNGEMALKSARTNPPKLILLDITMPGMDGFEVCEKLKKEELNQDVPVIFLSALKEEFDIVRGFQVGGVDFVTKPFKSEVLLARIDTHLTLSHLRHDLQNMNDALEQKVMERTREIVNANTELKQEIVQRTKAQEELRESEELYRLTLANLDDTLVILSDKDGRINYLSPSVETIFKYRLNEAYDMDISNLLGVTFIDQTIPKINKQLQVFETDITTKKGERRSLLISIKNTIIKDNIIIYTCRDITERKKNRQQLAESEARLNYALTASNEGIWDWDIANNTIVFNDSYFTMLGYQPDELAQTNNAWHQLIHPDDLARYERNIEHCLKDKSARFSMEYRLEEKNGDYIWILGKGKVVEFNGDKPIRMCGTYTDINSQKETEERLRQLASFDFLTNLPNRSLFLNMLDNAISKAHRNEYRVAVLFLDLDRFKTINDSLGHSAGDMLLQEVSHRLKKAIRTEDVVSRLGGDEFTILLSQIEKPYQAAEIAQRVIQAQNIPFEIMGHNVVVTPSIGIVIYPDNATSSENLLKKADAAMYYAKDAGGQNYKFFTEDMHQQAKLRLEMETSIRQALEDNEFVVYYQPKVNLADGEINGMEALCRRLSETKGLISPKEYIHIAEETGLILPLGELVLEKSLQDTKQWIDDGLFTGKVAVNISPEQFRQHDLLKKFDHILEKTGLPPENLELELTEAAVVRNIDESIKTMHRIKERGISLALDDFGTGYSSLNYLKNFPIDTLKIDMSFIKDIDKSSRNENIVEAIIKLAHVLDIKVVAEGVETTLQAEILTNIHCDTMQGYLFSKPLPSTELTSLLQAETTLKSVLLKKQA